MKKLILFLAFLIISSISFSQEINMINNSTNDVKKYITETYGNIDPISQNYSDQLVYIYITDDAQKISFYFTNNKCTFQRIDYPSVKDGENLVIKLDKILKRKVINIDVPDEYVWIQEIDDKSYEWSLKIKSNGASLVIRRNYTSLK